MKVCDLKNTSNYDRKMFCLRLTEKTIYDLSELMTQNKENQILYCCLEDIMRKVEIIYRYLNDGGSMANKNDNMDCCGYIVPKIQIKLNKPLTELTPEELESYIRAIVFDEINRNKPPLNCVGSFY